MMWAGRSSSLLSYQHLPTGNVCKQQAAQGHVKSKIQIVQNDYVADPGGDSFMTVFCVAPTKRQIDILHYIASEEAPFASGLVCPKGTHRNLTSYHRCGNMLEHEHILQTKVWRKCATLHVGLLETSSLKAYHTSGRDAVKQALSACPVLFQKPALLDIAAATAALTSELDSGQGHEVSSFAPVAAVNCRHCGVQARAPIIHAIVLHSLCLHFCSKY
jgi:hypothetical protein